ncbi:hypothetical protein GCM10027294_08600 [Marinactinospora endophytica]
MPAKAEKHSALRSYRRCRRRYPAGQAMAAGLSPVSPRPLRVIQVLAGRTVRGPLLMGPTAQVDVVLALTAVQLGPGLRGPRREGIAGDPATGGCKAWLLWVPALESAGERARPSRPVIKRTSEPSRPGRQDRDLSDPPYSRARMFTGPIAYHDQSGSP